MAKTADEIESPEEHILVVIVNKLTGLQQQINRLERRQNKVTEIVEEALTSAHTREELHERLRKVEKVLFPLGPSDPDSDYS